MKKILTNYRYYILAALAVITVLCLMAVPNDNLPNIAYAYCLVSSKILCLVFGWFTAKLTHYWEGRGSIPEYTDACKNF